MVVTLTVPANPAAVRLARLVTTGVAAQLGATIADLDDVRTVVDELCSLLVSHAREEDDITLRLSGADGVLQAAASARVQGPWRPDELAEGIVRVLADRYEVEEADGVLELTVEKSLEAASG